MVAWIQTGLILVFAGMIGFTAQDSRGATADSAPLALIAILLAFAALTALIARGMWRKSAFARTPMLFLQVFGVVVAWPVVQGDGLAPVAGGALILLSVVGLYLTLRPATGADMAQANAQA